MELSLAKSFTSIKAGARMGQEEAIRRRPEKVKAPAAFGRNSRAVMIM